MTMILKGHFWMKEARRNTGALMAIRHGEHFKKPTTKYCSVCTQRIWFWPFEVTEPEGVPEPRLSWSLCKPCFRSLVAEMRRSPLRSPLRMRIAMGLVAAERWPQAYPTRLRLYVSDNRWLVFMAVCFVVAMIIHLVVMVMVATLH